jgi:two-component system, OmpR family, aerobic respiration control sensor histidine kinase ArcB
MNNLPAEQSIQQTIQYYENIILQMPGHVYWLDTKARALGCNQNVLHMFGLKSVAQFKGLSFEEMGKICQWNAETIQSFKNDSLGVLRTGDAKLNVEEPPIANRDGKLTYFVTSRVPLFDANNAVVGVVGISIDITEQKKAEENLKLAKQKAEAANQAKTEFLENMRHDIRTPLSGIVGCAQIVKSEANNPETVVEYAEYLIQSSEALLEFLNRVLEATKVATGEIPLLKNKFDLRKQLQAIVDLNKSLALKKNIELILEYDEKIPTYLIGAPVRIQRIVLELVTNALTFTQQGKVHVAAKLKKQETQRVIIAITISDTGIGMAADKQEEIFIRFRRLIPSYQGIYKGLGIGLALVKQFIDDLGGEIYVKSQLNQGTTFTCLIPLQKPLTRDTIGVEDISLVIADHPKTATS